VPYAGRYGLDERFSVEEIKLKSRRNKTFVAKIYDLFLLIDLRVVLCLTAKVSTLF